MKNKQARSFVMIMIIIAVSSLVLRFALEQIMKINISQNESYAQATLKLISTALENYAKDHLGVYPNSLANLSQNNPPYLDKVYITESYIKGYDYDCPRLEASGYSCTASPVRCKLTGNTVYTISTGSLLVPEECKQWE